MLKAEELSIGDWVNVPNYYWDGRPYTGQVNGITKKHGTYYLQFGSALSAEIDRCQPIPITKEILEKNGFEEEVREGDPTFPYSAFILDGDDYHIEITWYDSHDRYEPNTGQFLGGVPEVWAIEVNSKRSNVDIERSKMYVHELQHALRLCGITKEIEL